MIQIAYVVLAYVMLVILLRLLFPPNTVQVYTPSVPHEPEDRPWPQVYVCGCRIVDGVVVHRASCLDRWGPAPYFYSCGCRIEDAVGVPGCSDCTEPGLR